VKVGLSGTVGHSLGAAGIALATKKKERAGKPKARAFVQNSNYKSYYSEPSA